MTKRQPAPEKLTRSVAFISLWYILIGLYSIKARVLLATVLSTRLAWSVFTVGIDLLVYASLFYGVWQLVTTKREEWQRLWLNMFLLGVLLIYPVYFTITNYKIIIHQRTETRRMQERALQIQAAEEASSPETHTDQSRYQPQ